jgi:hypothetical protein
MGAAKSGRTKPTLPHPVFPRERGQRGFAFPSTRETDSLAVSIVRSPQASEELSPILAAPIGPTLGSWQAIGFFVIT